VKYSGNWVELLALGYIQFVIACPFILTLQRVSVVRSEDISIEI